MVKHTASKPLIMVVEDEEPIALLLRYNLEAQGYRVIVISDGQEAADYLQDDLPDLLLLDWMLPSLSGIELCRILKRREKTRLLPIIMLTARGEESERIRGLDVGADDYIVKPFSLPELLARIKALLRRSYLNKMDDRLQIGNLVLDKQRHKVFRDNEELSLGPTEYRLLEFFMNTPRRVFSRTYLLDQVWGTDNYIDERTVDVHIRRLRVVINREGEDLIRTVRGAGYAFEPTED